MADLEQMDRDALVALYVAILGGEPPTRLSQPFLRRVLAWELQAREQGGLSPAVKRKLEALAVAQAGSKAQASTTPKLKTGGRLLREWNGVTHVVDVVEGGFLWRGERHRSLSAIARAITGAHWSGPRFFGLHVSASTAGAAAKSKAKKAGGRESKTAEPPYANGNASADATTPPSSRRRAA